MLRRDKTAGTATIRPWLSRSVLTHEPRQAESWLAFNVRQMRFLIPSMFAAIGIAHFLAYLSLIAHAIALDAFSETLPAWQSVVVGILSMPLMSLSKMFAGSIPAIVALAVANSLLWAAIVTGAFVIFRRGWRRSHENA